MLAPQLSLPDFFLWAFSLSSVLIIPNYIPHYIPLIFPIFQTEQHFVFPEDGLVIKGIKLDSKLSGTQLNILKNLPADGAEISIKDLTKAAGYAQRETPITQIGAEVEKPINPLFTAELTHEVGMKMDAAGCGISGDGIPDSELPGLSTDEMYRTRSALSTAVRVLAINPAAFSGVENYPLELAAIAARGLQQEGRPDLTAKFAETLLGNTKVAATGFDPDAGMITGIVVKRPL